MQNLIRLIPVNQLAKLVLENKEVREFFMELVKKHAPQIIGVVATALTLEKVKEILEVLKDRKISFRLKKGDTELDFNVD